MTNRIKEAVNCGLKVLDEAFVRLEAPSSREGAEGGGRRHALGSWGGTHFHGSLCSCVRDICVRTCNVLLVMYVYMYMYILYMYMVSVGYM